MLGESLDRQGGIVSVEKLILAESPSTISFRHIATLSNGTKIKKIIVFTQALSVLLWSLVRREIDIVHIHVSERGSTYRQMITALIVQAFHKPVIMHAHGSDFHEFYSNVFPPVQHLIRWIFRHCAQFIVLSESWRQFYIKQLGLYADRVVVLPNPVRLPSQVPNRSFANPINLIFLGRLGSRKGSFDLIHAFSQIPLDQRQKVILTLAGDGEVEQTRNLVKHLKLENCTHVLDWIDERERNNLLANADVFILPSYNEGLPMALLEAMSWGLPVIATPVGGIPEVVIPNQNGLLVNPGNIQQLIKAIQSLINDEDLRLRLGQAARASVLSLDITHYMNTLMDNYKLVLVSKM